MKAVLVFGLLVLVCASALPSRLHKLQRARKVETAAAAAGDAEWDIAEGISGAAVAMGKVEGHEQSVKDAYNLLSATDKAAIVNPTISRSFFEAMHTPTDLIMGLQYPDMPIGGATVTQFGDDLTSPTHVNAATFGSFFKLGAAGARNTFVAQTHYGCLQFWHAMAPEPYVGGKYKVWTNQAMSDLVKASNKRIWDVAVTKLKAGNKRMAEFHLGRILHTIGDSFARGHTARTGTDGCGNIVVWQEYNAQKGNEKHSDGDKPLKNKSQFACTVNTIRGVLSAWASCVRARGVGCGYPTGIINTFNVDSAVSALDAGGSLAEFAGPTAKATPARTVRASSGETFTVHFPPQGTLTKVAGTADLATVCPAF